MINEVILKELLKDMSEAELKGLQKRIDIILNGDLEELKNIDLSKINKYAELEDFLNAKELENKAKGTIKQYKLRITSMLDYVNKPVQYIKTEDIRRYLNYNKNIKNNSDSYLETQRIEINTFFKWLTNNGYISKNPCELIQQIKYEEKVRHPFSVSELNEIRKVCSTRRDKVIVEVLYSTGCRVSELIGLKLSDIDLKTREVHLFGKGRKHRTSFLNDKAVDAINNYLPYRHSNSDFLFVSERSPYGPITTTRAIEKKIKALGEKAGVAGGAFPHRFRHTIATDLLNNGMPIEQVQMFLGHTNISTTQIYAKTKLAKLKQSYFKYIT